MYQLSPTQYGQTESNSVIRLADGAAIPFDPDNSDAKEFAKWLSEGGVPEAAAEGETVSAEWIAETIAKLS